MKKQTILSLFVTASLVITSFISCGDKDKDSDVQVYQEPTDNLFEPTSIGANAVSCLVNGSNWANVNHLGNTGIRAEAYYFPSLGLCGFQAWRNSGSGFSRVIIDLEGINSPGVYNITDEASGTPHVRARFEIDSFNYSKVFNTTQQDSGILVIDVLDTVNKIFSGHFEFIASDQESTPTKRKIRQGNFDVKLP